MEAGVLFFFRTHEHRAVALSFLPSKNLVFHITKFACWFQEETSTMEKKSQQKNESNAKPIEEIKNYKNGQRERQDHGILANKILMLLLQPSYYSTTADIKSNLYRKKVHDFLFDTEDNYSLL